MIILALICFFTGIFIYVQAKDDVLAMIGVMIALLGFGWMLLTPIPQDKTEVGLSMHTHIETKGSK